MVDTIYALHALLSSSFHFMICSTSAFVNVILKSRIQSKWLAGTWTKKLNKHLFNNSIANIISHLLYYIYIKYICTYYTATQIVRCVYASCTYMCIYYIILSRWRVIENFQTVPFSSSWGCHLFTSYNQSDVPNKEMESNPLLSLNIPLKLPMSIPKLKKKQKRFASGNPLPNPCVPLCSCVFQTPSLIFGTFFNTRTKMV